MSKLRLAVLLILLSSCGGGSGGGGGGAGSTSGIPTGNWVSECLETAGEYYRIYFEMDGASQDGAFLHYDNADTTCSGAYDVTDGPAAYNEVDDFFTFSTDNELIDVTDVLDNYVPYSYVQGGTKYTLIYYVSSTELYVPGFPTTTEPGAAWSDWQANTEMDDFTADYTAGSVRYTKVSGLP